MCVWVASPADRNEQELVSVVWGNPLACSTFPQSVPEGNWKVCLPYAYRVGKLDL